MTDINDDLKIEQFELVSPKILYDRNLTYYYLDNEDLDELFHGLKTGVELTCAKLKEDEFRGFEYDISLRIILEEINEFNIKSLELLVYPLNGKFGLFSDAEKTYINRFQFEHNSMLDDIRKHYKPSRLKLEYKIIGYRDTITKSVT